MRTQTRLWVREGWEHIAAQGSYSRGASELLHALLPDMTNASLPPPAVRTLSSTPCNYPSRLPPAKYYGIEAIRLDGSDGSLATVAAASFRGGEATRDVLAGGVPVASGAPRELHVAPVAHPRSATAQA